MTKFFMYGHNGSYNHGCEAIVRSTSKIIKKIDKDADVNLASREVFEDVEYKVDEVVGVHEERLPYGKFTIRNIRAWLALKLKKDDTIAEDNLYYKTMSKLKKDDVFMSIGGDNYCYNAWPRFVTTHRVAREFTKKTVLWGCSVEEILNKEMEEDFKSYALIIARESLTYELLKKVNKNTKLYPDPAFVLDVKEPILPEGMTKEDLKKCIGINVSPLIIKREGVSGITQINYEKLIEHVLNETDDNVALIPHVEVGMSKDMEPLSELYEKYKASGRIFLIDNQGAENIKGVISNLKALVCARTHASVAAYSTCVPTLVVGYSVKAKGIAKDIFGEYDGYVIPVQDLKEEDDLTKVYKAFYSRIGEIKEHLESVMPAYIERAYEAGKELFNI